MTNDDLASVRLEAALEMWEDGVQIKRESLRRKYPSETAEQIESRIGDWLAERPGAEHGDAAQSSSGLERQVR